MRMLIRKSYAGVPPFSSAMHPTVREALKRGLRRRCPQCGQGPLFVWGIRMHERCSSCNLLYQRDRGDTWMFMIITDRIPILLGIAGVYFGVQPQTWAGIAGLFAALAIPVVVTLPHRQGMAVAIDYLTRR